MPGDPGERFATLGGFSDACLLYHEDVDVSMRVRLAGGRLGVEPAAVVDHAYGFAKGAAKWRYLERNRWATILRCYPTRLLVLLAPGLLATELALLVVTAAGGWLPQKSPPPARRCARSHDCGGSGALCRRHG
jgi:GT2 family glycosyltransferase